MVEYNFNVCACQHHCNDHEVSIDIGISDLGLDEEVVYGKCLYSRCGCGGFVPDIIYEQSRIV